MGVCKQGRQHETQSTVFFFSGNGRKQNVSLCYCEITPDIKTELYV